MKKLVVVSPSFMNMFDIPEEFSYNEKSQGKTDINPEISWKDAPKETKSFIILCEDPDAPTPEPFTHWLVYNIPASYNKIFQGIPLIKKLSGATIGINDFKQLGYNGMIPPYSQTHRYFFQVFALDIITELPEGMNREQILKIIKGHIIGIGSLTGMYTNNKMY
jgi:Raf kinase inhibitor-like YbhB/YbcL family protein